MIKRYQNSLGDLLEKTAYEGFASIEKWRINRWYGQERFTVNIRRDLRERWSELASEFTWISDHELVLADVKGQVLLMHDQVFFENDE